jgi:hypothetical protein
MLMGRPSIEAKFGSRTGKQCRERYRNHLSPHINHAPWSSEEDELLIRLHNSLGRHWTKFVDYLLGNDMMMMCYSCIVDKQL